MTLSISRARPGEHSQPVSRPRPATAVLIALRSGADTVPDLRRETGLSADVIDAVLGQLSRLGMVDRRTLSCTSSSCGLSCTSCPSTGSTAVS